MRQTNHEGELLDWLNAAADDADPGRAQRRRLDALLLRDLRRLRPADGAAGRGAHLRPAPAARGVPAHSVVTPHAVAVVAGHGIEGYRMALQKLRATTPEPPDGAGAAAREPPVEPEPEPVDEPVLDQDTPAERVAGSHRGEPDEGR